jgi:hypothetical protein
MKKKTINAIISKKVNDWLDSIEDKDLAIKIRNDVIVTGGCITSMLLNEDVNDFDVYLKTKESLKAVTQYYCNKYNTNNPNKGNHVGHHLHAWVLDGKDVEDWKNGNKKLSEFAYDYKDIPYSSVKGWTYNEKDENKSTYLNVSGMVLNTPPDRIKIMVNSDGIAEDGDSKADEVEYSVDEYLKVLNDGDEVPGAALEETPKYKPVFLSSNAITLSNKVQIVVRFYGKPEEIHENYDFVHVTNYWTYQEGLVLNQKALEAILNKELVYVGSKYPICSLVRTRKFIKRGWQINAGQYVKMSFQISKLNLSDIYVLEDQLVGVDSIYFLNFTKALKEKQLKDSNFVLSQQYLSTVIDKIFG